MNRRQNPRTIDLSRARRNGASPAHRAAGSRAAQSAPGASRGKTTAGARAPQHRQQHTGAAYTQARRPVRTNTAAHPPVRKTKRRRRKSFARRLLRVVVCIALIAALGYGGINWFVSSIFHTGEMGELEKPSSDVQEIVPEDLKGVMNILVLGIDYSSDDAVKRDPIGQTDMIMYVRVDGTNHSMKMMQITRDMFVGKIGGSAGKINGIFANSADTENRVNTLAQYITKIFGLPIDDYVTIDMDSLRAIVDTFGGIEVYIPKTMEYDGSRLEQGWHNLMGKECEFFLRQRKDSSATPRGDLDRLANQQYFYSAMFRRVRTATVKDIIKLTPVIKAYINTSLDLVEMIQLGMSVLTIPSENIIIGRVPVARGELYNGQDVMVCAKKETAEFLNEYFRPADQPIQAQQIGSEDWPTRSIVIGAEVRRMGEVDAAGGTEPGAPEDSNQAAQAQQTPAA